MELLFSNIPPIRTDFKKFSDCFFEQFQLYKGADISVGYITADSLTELKGIIEQNDIHHFNLTIGMHYFERFTALEYNAAIDLNSFLCENHLGQVNVVTTFMYHGKLYSFIDQRGNAHSGIIGSNNLSSIIDSGTRLYESSILITQQPIVEQIHCFINDLATTASTKISDLEIDEFRNVNPLLENHEHVRKVSQADVDNYSHHLTNTNFEIPLKGFETAPKSNLNAFFGEGRRTPNGMIMPRHWYEVELIVPVEIATLPNYPISQTPGAVFDVITDDGWEFSCKISGQNNKNFRSENDLKILGKWIKGRLENAGVLRVGDPVTQSTLQQYGRTSFTLTKLDIPNKWFINFAR